MMCACGSAEAGVWWRESGEKSAKIAFKPGNRVRNQLKSPLSPKFFPPAAGHTLRRSAPPDTTPWLPKSGHVVNTSIPPPFTAQEASPLVHAAPYQPIGSHHSSPSSLARPAATAHAPAGPPIHRCAASTRHATLHQRSSCNSCSAGTRGGRASWLRGRGLCEQRLNSRSRSRSRLPRPVHGGPARFRTLRTTPASSRRQVR